MFEDKITPKKAMELIIERGVSKYKIAKTMKIQPIMVDKYLKEETKTIRLDAAKRLKRKYKVEVHDFFINGVQRKLKINEENELDD